MNKFEEIVKFTLDGKRPTNPTPFYLYTYDPKQELTALDEFNKLGTRLKNMGYSIATISMVQLFWDSIKSLIKDLGIQNLKKLESNRKQLYEDISREIIRIIGSRIIKLHEGKGQDYCSIITRTGCLFPFIHISNLIARIGGNIKATLVILYPGRKGYMLNYPIEEPHLYYRGEFF